MRTLLGKESMKERPVLFSAPMVRALLAGTKTQTRRLVKIPGVMPRTSFAITSPNEEMLQLDDGTFHYLSTGALSGPYACPYGVPGDRLWVREAVRFDSTSGNPWITYLADNFTRPVQHPYEGTFGRARPSIHMPRWACRLTLEITDIRVQRLQEISEQDVLAEGITRWPLGYRVEETGAPDHYSRSFDRAAEAYRWLWDSINARYAPWDSNPYVWALTFKRVQP